MAKIIFATITSLFSFFAYAQSHETCVMQNRDSCWFAFNMSAERAIVSCLDTNDVPFKTVLDVGAYYSYQYNIGWNGGTGYPDEGVVSACSVKLASGKRLNFQIAAISGGNPVEIKIFDDKVTVRQSTWYPNGRELIKSHSF